MDASRPPVRLNPTGALSHNDGSDGAGPAHAVVVRSSVAHGLIKRIDVRTARAMPGVLGVWTGPELQSAGFGDKSTEMPRPGALAIDKVYFVGHPVAVVIATSRADAECAAETVRLDIETLPALMEPRDSARFGVPQIFDGVPGNTCASYYTGDYDKTVQAFAKSAHVTKLRFAGNRFARRTVKLQEGVGSYDPSSRRCIINLAGSEPCVQTEGDMHWPEYAGLSQSAQLLGRAIQWTAAAEGILPGDQEPHDYDFEWELALDTDGRFLAVHQSGFVSVGAFLLGSIPSVEPETISHAFAALYGMSLVESRVKFVFTNTTPQRRPSEPAGPAPDFAVERLIDAAAREMKIDPFVLRKRNLTRLDDIALVDRVAKWADVAGFPGRKVDSAKRSRLLGLGVGNCSSASTPWQPRVAEVEVNPATGGFAIMKYTAVNRAGTTTCANDVRTYTGEAIRADAQSAAMNAIVDALGGKQVDMPVTPYRVWQALNAPAPMLGLN